MPISSHKNVANFGGMGTVDALKSKINRGVAPIVLLKLVPFFPADPINFQE